MAHSDTSNVDQLFKFTLRIGGTFDPEHSSTVRSELALRVEVPSDCVTTQPGSQVKPTHTNVPKCTVTIRCLAITVPSSCDACDPRVDVHVHHVYIISIITYSTEENDSA